MYGLTRRNSHAYPGLWPTPSICTIPTARRLDIAVPRCNAEYMTDILRDNQPENHRSQGKNDSDQVSPSLYHAPRVEVGEIYNNTR